MSATNRGAIRNGSDFYITPRKTISTFLDVFKLEGIEIFEPTAGNGAIVQELWLRYHAFCNITANDIRDEQAALLEAGADRVFNLDFLKCNGINPKPDVIITNPPFSIAQEIIEKCFEIAKPETEVIMLLRLAFLESKKRREFWKKHPLTQLYPLIERPSFTGRGTDATAYGWFVWSDKRQPLIKSI